MYKGAATVTADEDAQGLEEPIIAPVKTKTFSKLDKEASAALAKDFCLHSIGYTATPPQQCNSAGKKVGANSFLS